MVLSECLLYPFCLDHAWRWQARRALAHADMQGYVGTIRDRRRSVPIVHQRGSNAP
jgi:hypothetical protein